MHQKQNSGEASVSLATPAFIRVLGSSWLFFPLLLPTAVLTLWGQSRVPEIAAALGTDPADTKRILFALCGLSFMLLTLSQLVHSDKRSAGGWRSVVMLAATGIFAFLVSVSA